MGAVMKYEIPSLFFFTTKGTVSICDNHGSANITAGCGNGNLPNPACWAGSFNTGTDCSTGTGAISACGAGNSNSGNICLIGNGPQV
jgi:hypothetical protein